MKKQFPDTLYVAIENEQTTDQYLSASKDFASFAVVDNERPVAVYKLVRVAKLKAKATLDQ